MVGYFMKYRCHQKLKRPCAYQNLIYFMALCKTNWKIYAFLEKNAPTFKMRGLSSNIAQTQSGGVFPKDLIYENGLQNLF